MKFVRYERKKGDEEEFLHGLEDKEGNFYEAIEFNEFKRKPSKIPNGFRKVRISSEWVLKYFYDPGKTPLQKDNEAFLKIKAEHSKEKVYFTHDNGGRPFAVYISKERISVYREVQNKFYVRETDRDSENSRKNTWFYIEHVVSKKNYSKVWIGKSIPNKTTKAMGTDNNEFLGNCILVKLSPLRYLFIGESVFEFSAKEEILKFYAPVGNNDVPYSYAVSEKYVFFMRENLCVPISAFKKFTKEVEKNAYDSFYEDDMETKGIPFKKVKEIQSRLY